MSNLSVDYTGEWISISADVTEPQEAANAIFSGGFPRNLVSLSASASFRDATLAYILENCSNHDSLLNTMVSAIRNAPAESEALKAYTDYAAAIAFAIGKSDLAVKIIKRNNPAAVTPHIWAIVTAMKKQMPSAFYASLVMSSGPDALSKWEIERSQYVTI